MRIFRKFKFKIRKWWKTINDSPSTIKITKMHNIAFTIFRIALKNPKSELILMPIASKRIIKIDKQDLYIKLEKFSISITNHKYNYMIEIPYDLYEKLVKMFDNKIDNNYYQEENQMLSQLEMGIENVLKTIMKDNG